MRENLAEIDSYATASLRFLPLFRRASFLSLSLSFAARITDASNHFSRGFPFPFPLWESLLSLPLLLPLAGVVFPAGRTSASPRGVAFRPRRRETKFRRWQRWAQRRHEPPPPVRVSRTRVRRVHGEDQEDQEEVHRCGPNVPQLGRERRVRKEPGVHVRELLLRCVVVIVVVVARRFIFLSLSLAHRSLLPTTADDGIDRVSLGRRALRKRSLTTRIF